MNRALPSAILPRVGQLLRMLGSDQGGEVIAAAGALRRTLVGAGVDLHDLAAAVERPAAQPATSKRPAARKTRKAARPRPAEPSPRQPPPPPPPRQPYRPDLVQLGEEQRTAILEGLAEAVEDADGRLNDWSRKFAADLLDQLGRRRLCPTERQLVRIQQIVAQVRGEL